MASGKKNYFRHSIFARNDEFIMCMIEKFGLQSYYYYFALLEMCGEKSSDEIPKSFKFHRSTLVKGLRCSTRKLNLFLTYLQGSSKVLHTYSGGIYEIIIPNFSKYMGYYKNKTPLNKEKKRKVLNKEKEKDVRPVRPNFDFEIPYSNYPRKVGKSRGVKKLQSSIKQEEDYYNFCLAVNNYRKFIESNNTERKYIKHFSTFANEWEDWINYKTDTEIEKIKDLEMMKEMDKFFGS